MSKIENLLNHRGEPNAKNGKEQSAKGVYPSVRPRRLRSHDWLRDMVAENTLSTSDLIWPLFICEGHNNREIVPTMPGVERTSIDLMIENVKQAADQGIPAVALFPVVPAEKKTMDGAEATNPDNLICRAIYELKNAIPDIGIITDVALDPFTTHGHDGLTENGKILNDPTLEVLCAQALVQAQAGADIIAPSDMMDGRVGAIRKTMDNANFQDTAIMAYAAKYASCFYGPFRDAVNSGGFLKGDKKTYQMNPANSDEALKEVALDLQEGADMVMIKPGLPYLDIIHRVKDEFNTPTFAYQVSGEYAMLQRAASACACVYEDILAETLICFKRAGADGILTYGALDMAKILNA